MSRHHAAQGAKLGHSFSSFHRLQQAVDEGACIGHDGQRRLHQRLGQLGGVDVDLHDARALREAAPVVAGLADVQPRADDDHQVGRLQAQVAGARADGAGAAGEERVVALDQVVRPGGGQRHAGGLHQLDQRVARAGQTHAAAGQDHRAVRLLQPAQHLLQFGLRQGRRGWGGQCADLEGLGRRLKVDRDVQPHRAGPARGGQRQRLRQHAAQFFQRADGPGALGERPQHVDDGYFLVAQLAQPGHGRVRQRGGALDLARDHDHRDRVGVGAVHAVQRIEPAGAGGHVHQRRLAGDARIAFGRHRAGLLMVHHREAHALLRGEGVVEKHRPAAGDGEDLLHALRCQPGGDALRGVYRNTHNPPPTNSAICSAA